MAKDCEHCKQSFADDLQYCPHCGAWSGPGPSEKKLGDRIHETSSADFDLGPIHGEQLEKSSSADFELAPLATGPAGQPGPELPAAQGEGPDDLVEIDWSAVEDPSAPKPPSSHRTPKPTQVVPLAKPVTQLAKPEDQAARTGSGPHPKTTQIASGSAPATQLAPPDAGPGSGKITQVAAGSAPATQLAPPDAGPGSGKITQVAAGSTPATHLAQPDELPDRDKSTQIAAGSSPGTHVADPAAMDVSPDAAEAKMTGSSDDFELRDVPPGRMMAGSSGEFDLGEAVAKGPTGDPLDELVEIEMEGAPGQPVETGRPDSAVGSGIPRATKAEPVDEPDVVHLENLLDEGGSAGGTPAELGADSGRSPQPGAPARSGRVAPQALAEGAVEADVDVQTAAADDSSAINLGSRSGDAGPSAGLGAIHSHGRARTGEDDEIGAVAVAETEDEEEERLGRGRRKPSTVVPWLGGAGVGVLAASVAWLGLWFAGVEPPASWRGASDTRKAVAPRAVNPNAGSSVSRESPRTHLERGDFARVLEEEIPAGEPAGPEQPERLAARGEARWLSYVQQQRRNHAPVDASARAVDEAKQDLQRADTAQGTFWLGQIQEAARDFAGARKTYEEGLKRFQDRPEQARLFQSALDRLDALSDETPASADKAGAFLDFRSRLADEVLLLVALQAGAPEGARSEGEEAGAYFWSAVKLAKQNKYSDALTALKKARAVHEDRRFERLRKSQNPTTDPTEEIFLRACDELAVYWKLREELFKGGYLAKGKPADAPKILADLLAGLKNKPADGAMQVVIDRLKKEKEVTSVDPDLKDIGKDLDLLLGAKQKTEELLASIQGMLREAKVISDQQPDVAKGLEKLLKEQKERTEALAAVVQVLGQAKYVTEQEPDPKKGVERLLADKKLTADKVKDLSDQLKAADTTLQEVAAKLAAANAVPPGARGEALVKGLDQVMQGGGSPGLGILGQVTGELIRVGVGAAGQLVQVAVRTTRLAADRLQDYLAGLRAVASTRPEVPIPEPAVKPDPVAAERFYAAGLGNFWSQQYQAAESDFYQAARAAGSGGLDARYLYFLGLARLGQGRGEDARSTFQQAARLEREHHPGSAVVDRALERVQGQARRLVDSYRP